MKTEFRLQCALDGHITESFEKIKIIGVRPKYKPYVSIETENGDLFINDRDLELFAINILKSLKSKRLTSK